MTTLNQLHSIDEFKIGGHYLIQIDDYEENENPVICKVKVKLTELRKNENYEGRYFNVCVFDLEEKAPSCLGNDLGYMFLNGKNIGDTVELYDIVDDKLFVDNVKIYDSPVSSIMIPKMVSASLPDRANAHLTKYTTEFIEKGGKKRSRKHRKRTKKTKKYGKKSRRYHRR